MAWFLRKVKWSRWKDRLDDPAAPFSALSPDPLGDVATSQRKLSLWQVESDRANLDRVVALLAAGVQAPAECAFILFPKDCIEGLDLQIAQNDGGSPDAAANVKWHYDLVVASAGHLVRLARFLLSQGDLQRKNAAEVKKLLHEGIAKNELDPSRMDQRLREKLRLDS